LIQKKLYYCDTVTNSGNVATNRFVSPCSIFGYFNTPAVASGNVGLLRVDYVVTFSGGISPSSITRFNSVVPSRADPIQPEPLPNRNLEDDEQKQTLAKAGSAPSRKLGVM